MRATIREVVNAIHANSSAYATVGMGMIDGLPLVTGLGLAFPDPLNPPPGCPFHPRCAQRVAACSTQARALATRPQGAVACHLHHPIASRPAA